MDSLRAEAKALAKKRPRRGRKGGLAWRTEIRAAMKNARKAKQPFKKKEG